MKIPFSEIPFPNGTDQEWHINFYRRYFENGNEIEVSSQPRDRNNNCVVCQTTDNLILKDIVTGAIGQGQKLNEPELARIHGISRGPLREAMGRLEAMRLITRVPNVGARVVQLSYDVLLEIYQIRESLEGLAARLAAETMTGEEKLSLRALLTSHHKHLLDTQGQSYF